MAVRGSFTVKVMMFTSFSSQTPHPTRPQTQTLTMSLSKILTQLLKSLNISHEF